MKTIRVLLVDDHEMVREGLRRILEQDAGIELVGEAGSGLEAVRLAADLSPDVAVMDVGMPEMNGIEATREVLRADPDVRVVALSTHSDKRYVRNMLEAGAVAYVLKSAASDELLRAVHGAVEGGVHLNPTLAAIAFGGAPAAAGRDDDAFRTLGPRERQVLQLLAEGHTTKQIGECMSISPKTVETHRSNIARKLGIHGVAELTKYAVREGLTTL